MSADVRHSEPINLLGRAAPPAAPPGRSGLPLPNGSGGQKFTQKPASRGRASVPRPNAAVAPKLHTHRTPQLPDAVDPPQVYVIGGKEFSTEQVVGMVFSFYCVLGFLGTRGGSKKEAPKAAESAPAAGGSVVSMLDDGFEAWAASPANMKKWEDSIAEMK